MSSLKNKHIRKSHILEVKFLKDFEVFLRRYPSPFRSGCEWSQLLDYAANLQSAA